LQLIKIELKLAALFDCSPTEFTILELARQVIEFVGSGSRIADRPLPPDGPRQRRPDISKARDVLSWSPRTPLAEGLKRTIAYFEELLRDRSVRANLSSATVGAPSSSS